ncbi:MAG TPA: hypothetical protein V6C97_31050 [Oculatellaceae cyanobacterium]
MIQVVEVIEVMDRLIDASRFCFCAIALLVFSLVTCIPLSDARLLEGGLQHSEQLPPLSDQFKVGGTFNSDMLGRRTDTDEWVMIPPTVAGTWSRNGSVLLSVHDITTDKWKYPNTLAVSHGTYIRGFQLDANGNIWDCPRARQQRFEMSSDGRTKVYIILTGKRQMLATGPKTLHDYGEATIVDVDATTGIIKRVERSEQVVERTAIQDGLVVAECQKSSYTPQGKLLTTATDRSEERRVAPFSPIDSLDGMDLKASFQRFQQNQQNQPNQPNQQNATNGASPQ